MIRLRRSFASRALRGRAVVENHHRLQQKIAAAPGGSAVAAFFDMDQTLVAGNSSILYVQRAMAEERAGMSDLFKTIYYYLLYRFNRLSVDAILKPTLEGIRGRQEAQFADFCRQIALKELLPRVGRQARLVLDWHRERGHRCVLLTAATCYLAQPLAEALGMDAVLSTQLEVAEGLFTGRLHGLGLCYGEGKVKAAQLWAAAAGVELMDSFFYTDSASDLPMLSAVGIPVAVNPDWVLRRLARRKGWLACRWPRQA
ncbi:HAD family hydrolase [Gloeobacter morelensis]|uniref:HAD family hydrolase n=1 Tax=Gloeobacter morelensis MG652769 TaxID=2781736 RepID=A0ABY3PRN7_9CYAN|nr:HAD family hydrolase [Gloeobacter morelensis]UFP96361.1 HAD family hydrolase [Gloeobacter morelensis MG652769]